MQSYSLPNPSVAAEEEGGTQQREGSINFWYGR